VFPLSTDRKAVVHEFRLELHIIFVEQVSGALQEVWRIIYCHNLLVLILEVWLPYRSTQLFQGPDVVGAYVTNSGNNS
jgi:hypothetical protein